jgi:23S rRNA pseudouridine1911/1915/1917 synthase
MSQGNMLKIVFEDERLIVVDKPCGMLTMSAGRQGEVTAYSLLYDYMSGKRSRSGHDIYIVHRLDRDTSGLLVFAKDFETKIRMQENWNECVKERKYTAILEGRIEDEEGWIETWLYENPKSLKVHCFPLASEDRPDRPPRKDWKYASSHCRTLKSIEADGRWYTHVEFELETGRKNQIRTHSSWIGHPIAGDRKYDAVSDPIGRLALHAKTLSFIHPWTGKTLRFSSPVPKSFNAIGEPRQISKQKKTRN